MNVLAIELRKQRRTGVALILPAVGGLGAAYAFVNFAVRGETLLSFPLPPMDVLLTQVYGMIMALNLFGIVAAACIAYNMEFRGGALKKMRVLPISVPAVFLCKWALLAALLACALSVQGLALAKIGVTYLPSGAFAPQTLARFMAYAFITSMPVLSFMLLVASRLENIWAPLGVGVAGFLSGMALANVDARFMLIHPFVVMLKPAAAMSAQCDGCVAVAALLETLACAAAGARLARIPERV